jgi:hypothetical protein
VIDVRRIPRSRTNPQYNCDTLPETPRNLRWDTSAQSRSWGRPADWLYELYFDMPPSFTDSEWAARLLAASLVVGVAISGAILMLP